MLCKQKDVSAEACIDFYVSTREQREHEHSILASAAYRKPTLLSSSLRIYQPNGTRSCLLLFPPSSIKNGSLSKAGIGLSPNGWRVFGAKLNLESVAVGSAPTHLAGETRRGPVLFGKCLRR